MKKGARARRERSRAGKRPAGSPTEACFLAVGILCGLVGPEGATSTRRAAGSSKTDTTLCKQFIKLGTKAWRQTLKRQIVVDAREILRSIKALSCRAKVEAVLDVTEEEAPAGGAPPTTCMRDDSFVSWESLKKALRRRLDARDKVGVAVLIPLAWPEDDPRPPLVAYFEAGRMRALAVDPDGTTRKHALRTGPCGYVAYVIKMH